MTSKVAKEKAMEETLWQACDKLRGSIEPAIISPAYHVFKVNNENEILPEVLLPWFYRPESNRFGWFISDSSVRASLEWEQFQEIEVPVPDAETQKAIVTIYHTLETRKKINEQLKNSIQPLCPVLMRGVVKGMEAKDLKKEAI